MTHVPGPPCLIARLHLRRPATPLFDSENLSRAL